MADLAERTRVGHPGRMAHRVLRLREQGVDAEKIAALGDLADVSPDLTSDQPAPPATRLARAVVDSTDSDLPGPTDKRLVERLLSLDTPDLFREWYDASNAACKQLDPKGYAAARKSIEEQRAAREQLDERASWTGEWPDRRDFRPHGTGIEVPEYWAANAFYDLGREGFALGEIDWDTATIKAILVDTGLYTVDLATHKFVSSIAAGARVATSAAFAGKTGTAGVLDANDITYSALTGSSIEAIALMQSSAVGGGADVADTAQRLIAFLDTATGLPFTPSGSDLTVAWDNGANRVGKL